MTGGQLHHPRVGQSQLSKWQEIHTQGVPFPSCLQIPSCLHVVQVLWSPCLRLLHTAASGEEGRTIWLGALSALVAVVATSWLNRTIRVCLSCFFSGLILAAIAHVWTSDHWGHAYNISPGSQHGWTYM